MRAVCVIGLGLIGGSVLRAASAAGRPAWGATASEADATAAREAGFEALETDAALRRAKQEDALVVIAVPLPAVREVLRRIADVHPGAWLTDVVSVKDPVDFEVRKLTPRVRYAGGHPMAGTSASGFAAASADLFRGAAWAVTIEEATTIEAWREAAELALDCGAHVVPTGAAAHDDTVARVSHLPHLFAAILAAVGADGGPLALSLAAGSFRDGTRVAGSDPELVRAMTEGNKPALLDAVDDALGRLGAARGSLASTGGLKSTLDAGYEARRRLDALAGGEGTTTASVRLRPEALARLRDLGELGGRVTAIAEDHATTEVPVG
ncbi:prephenate dehydrogenase [Saccharopolyspora rhizosphaerae]|uniref:Prephenate dehydrogenase n=1 Tax=Saccharopolyspora rhizosphaerae TaxID=2492662 RepID=A0A426JPH5_9PSEU|nr:prephenate dehydrogenase [Saccharopolyspora rhizosphaerae]RRO15118.1 prephenate dehydrogenase [Saccharopolyspora rhizosphaerae]